MSRGNTGLDRVTDSFSGLVRRFTASLASGDTDAAEQVIDEALKGQRSLIEIYAQIIAPALVSIGDSWCTGGIGVGDEHLATQIVIEQMNRLRSLFITPEPRSPYRVLVGCIEGEQHFVGARMITDLCLLRGWGVDFLGANTPAKAVVEMAGRRHAHVVALSLTLQQGMRHVRRVVEDLNALSPPPTVILGGQLFAANSLPARLQGGCAVARDAAEGVELIGKLLRSDRPKAMLREYLLTLGRRVRELRTNKRWTQEELAQATRVTRVCIVAVEGGKQNVSMDILIRLANALSVSPELLLSSDGMPGVSQGRGA